jgi:integrase
VRKARDRALAAILCFSGVRIAEAINLHWEDLDTHLTGVGYYGLAASIDRDGRRLKLPLPRPIGEALEKLKEASECDGMPAVGPVFSARGRPDQSLRVPFKTG